jgi:hypothetical protein
MNVRNQVSTCESPLGVFMYCVALCIDDLPNAVLSSFA